MVAGLCISFPLALSALSGPVQLAGWSFEGDQAGARLGASLATADVNGDGFGDLVVGAPGASAGLPGEGRVHVFLGSSGGLANVPDWSVRGSQRDAHLGTHVAFAGDVNADGFDDVVFAAPGWDRRAGAPKVFATGALDPHERYTTDEGAILVFHGSPTGLMPGRAIVGLERGERFGSAIAGVGDVDGDGFDDVLVGATGKLGGRGALSLFDGSASGTKVVPSWMHVGTVPDRGLGSAVAAAGDGNDDGFDDFVGVETTGRPCGRVLLFPGSVGGPLAPSSTSASHAVLGPVADFDQDGQIELIYARAESCSGEVADLLLWHRSNIESGLVPSHGSVAALVAGDVNGDGRREWITGSPGFENGPFHGRAHVYLNTPPWSFHAQSTPRISYEGEQAGAGFGAALAAVDVDGDAKDELFIAAPEQDGAATDAGRVVLHPGWESELPVVVTDVFPREEPLITADFDADGLDDLVTQHLDASGIVDEVRVRYGDASGLSGFETLTIPPLPNLGFLLVYPSTGDVNGDGAADVVLTYFNFYVGHGGRALDRFQHALYLGSPAGLDAVAALVLQGGSGSAGARFAGDVNADGFDDVLVVHPDGDRLHLGSSAGLTATPIQTLPAVETNIDGVYQIAADLDGDAFGDLVLSRVDSMSRPALHFHRGSATGLLPGVVFQPPELQSASEWATLGGLLDVDLDGIDDLLIHIADALLVYRRIAPSGFQRAPMWFEDDAVLTKEDLDGDGVDDLFLAGRGVVRGTPSGFVRQPLWLTDVGPSRVPQRSADFDGDGRPSFARAIGNDTVVLEIQ
jgi:hypothetical protein